MSSIRPLVQEPMTTWSILMSLPSAAGRVFSGRWGQLTVGTRVSRSMVMVRSYSASSSASYFFHARWLRPFRYASQVSSTGKIPFLAPASMAMLQMHRRSSMVRLCTPEPVNSRLLYRAPETPMRPIRCKITSLPDTGRCRAPVSSTRMAAGTLNQALPVAMPAAMSVEPTPVEKAPTAP